MLVGREQELNVLNERLTRTLDGEGSIVFLTGEAGLGKTTLVREWWKTIEANYQQIDTPLFVEGVCSIPTANMNVADVEALQVWADIIAQIQGVKIQDTAKKKIDFKKLIHETAPTWAWAIPFVGDIAHAALETSRLVKEQRQTLVANANNGKQQAFQQYDSILSKIAQARPLIIFLDDMHWSDAASANLLFYLMREIATKRILIIVAFRADEASALDDGKGHPIIKVKNEVFRYSAGTELSLHALDAFAINVLLAQTFPLYMTDVTFERWLYEMSDGNAMFITQFIKTLQNNGQLNNHGAFIGKYDDTTLHVSDIALAVVDERTRRLNSETRELLRYAAVEGVEFTSYLLSKMTGKKALELLKEMRKAEGAGVVRCTGSSKLFANQTTMMYTYTHRLFHQALYNSLNEQEKEILHRECFEALKTEWETHKDAARATELVPKIFTHAKICGELNYAALALCESGLLVETHANTLLGNERDIKLAEAVRFLDDGIRIFSERKHPETAKYIEHSNRVHQSMFNSLE